MEVSVVQAVVRPLLRLLRAQRDLPFCGSHLPTSRCYVSTDSALTVFSCPALLRPSNVLSQALATLPLLIVSIFGRQWRQVVSLAQWTERLLPFNKHTRPESFFAHIDFAHRISKILSRTFHCGFGNHQKFQSVVLWICLSCASCLPAGR